MNIPAVETPVLPAFSAPEPSSDNQDELVLGQLFFDDQVTRRQERIAYALSNSNILYLREAAGSKNVWMDDNQFAQLVTRNDPVLFSCFARSEQMKPHHLLFLTEFLMANPHQYPFLANGYEARITLMKSIEVYGGSRELDWMRSVVKRGSDQGIKIGPDLWHEYCQVKALSGAMRTGSEAVRSA